MSDLVETTLDQLTPDPMNPNAGTRRGREMLEESLETLGVGRSILLDKNGAIIAGNKTAQAATALGMGDVVIVQTDGSQVVAVQRTDLDLEHDTKAKRLALMDNRVGEIDLEWDKEVIQQLNENNPEVLEGLFTDLEILDILTKGDQDGVTINEDELVDSFQAGLKRQAEGMSITFRFVGEGEIAILRAGLRQRDKSYWVDQLYQWVLNETERYGLLCQSVEARLFYAICP
jgi:hypothetical protein